MPEVAEVKLFADGLRNAIINKKPVTFTLGGRYSNTLPKGWDRLPKILESQATVTGVSTKGKLLWVSLSTGDVITSTLGMSGAWRLGDHHKHTALLVRFEDGTRVSFTDPRHFDTLAVLDQKQLTAKLKTLGPDVLGEWIDIDQFVSIVKKAKGLNVTRFLMEQKWISGVGNYLKAEILYASKISPHRTCDSLSQREIFALERECRNIPQASYAVGGASVRTYSDFDGEKGHFADHLKVYSRDTDLLGNKVERFESLDGRTTHWVPSVQL